jgi:hypothetical protein
MKNRSRNLIYYRSRIGHNQSVFVTCQEKQVVRPQDLSSLKEGEFNSMTVEGREPFFWSFFINLNDTSSCF